MYIVPFLQRGSMYNIHGVRLYTFVSFISKQIPLTASLTVPNILHMVRSSIRCRVDVIFWLMKNKKLNICPVSEFFPFKTKTKT